MKLALLWLLILAAPAYAQESADERALRGLWQQLETGLNAGDAKSIAATFAEDADRVSGAGPWVRGRAAIEKQYAQMIGGRAADPATEPLRADITVRFLKPDVALVDGRWRGRRGGRAVAGHFLLVATKRANGWLFDAGRAWDFDAEVEDRAREVRTH